MLITSECVVLIASLSIVNTVNNLEDIVFNGLWEQKIGCAS